MEKNKKAIVRSAPCGSDNQSPAKSQRDNSPLPRVEDRLCDCSWQNHIGGRGMRTFSACSVLEIFTLVPFPNCLGRVVPSAAATALGAELEENLDDAAMFTLIVWVAEGALACPR